jgi:hypothetical protein
MTTVGTINITDHLGRTAKVRLRSMSRAMRRTSVDAFGRPIMSKMILAATAASIPSSISSDPQVVAESLIASDAEIDISRIMMPVKNTCRVFVTDSGEIARGVRAFDVKRSPEGEEKDRRQRVLPMPNINVDDQPVRLIDKQSFELNDLIRRFVVRRKVQLAHSDDLTYGFLFDLAKHLESSGRAVMVGAGPRGKAPLILRRGGLPHFAFLTGHTEGNSYSVVLHLSNQELKSPEVDG